MDSHSLNQCSFEEYNLECLNNHPSAVIIKVDVFSILAFINDLVCFKSISDLVKNFYLKSFIQLSFCFDISDFDEKLKSVLTVMLTKVQSATFKEKQGALSEEYDNNTIFQDLFKNFESIMKQRIAKSVFSYSPFDGDCEANSELKNHIECIKNSIEMNPDTTVRRNSYYLPQLYTTLEPILRHFLSWTKIISSKNSFDTATSCAMKTLDSLTNDNVMLPLHLTNFLDSHILEIKLLMQKGRAFLDQSNHLIGSGKNINQYFRCLSLEEEWMGQKNLNFKSESENESESDNPDIVQQDKGVIENENKSSCSLTDLSFQVKETSTPNNSQHFANVQFKTFQKSKKNFKQQRNKKTTASKHLNPKKRKYLTPCPAMRIIHKQKVSKSQKGRKGVKKVNLIVNEELKGTRTINKKTYKFRSSSIIDSLSEIVRFSYLNFTSFQQSEDLLCSSLCGNVCLMKCILNCINSGKLTSYYFTRVKIMLEFGIEEGDRVTINDDFSTLFSNVMKHHCSYEINMYCTNCIECKYRSESQIQICTDSNFKIQNLEELVNDKFSWNIIKCDTCTDDYNISYTFKAYMGIELKDFNQKIHMNEIPKIIIIKEDLTINEQKKETTFALAGVVAYDEFNSHVAYCRTISDIWDKRSNIEKAIKGMKNPIDIKIYFLFYVKS